MKQILVAIKQPYKKFNFDIVWVATSYIILEMF